jgi:hypothetical protein
MLFERPKLINKCHFLNKLRGLGVGADFYRRDRLGLVRRRITVRSRLPLAPQPLAPVGTPGRNLTYRAKPLAAKAFGGTDRARRRMAARAGPRQSPNLPCKYRCTLMGEIGLPPLKARRPSGVRITGTARCRTSTFNRRPRLSLFRRSFTDLGDGRNSPSETPLE